MTVRGELMDFIRGWNLEGVGEVSGSTSLIESGLVDSLALFNLVAWIEERTGEPIDPAALDLPREWDTIDAIVRFVEGRRAGSVAPPRGSRGARAPRRGCYEIVKYTPEFRTQVVQLQTYHWSPDAALNGAYFRWKYEENPYVPQPQVYLALSEGRVVGMRGMCGAKWQSGVRTAPGPYADDLVIAPDHRNQGLFSRIMRLALDDLALEGHEYAFNLSASRVTLLESLAPGWKSAGVVHPVGRLSRWELIFQRLRASLARKRLGWRLASNPALFSATERRPFARLDRRAGRRGDGVSHFVSLSREARPGAMADLVTRLGTDGRIRHVRDAAFFAWRFRNPLHEYRFLYREKERLDGYMVLQRYRSTGSIEPRVNIVDWEAADGAARRELLDAALTWGEFAELGTWTATLDPESRELLRQRGFAAVAQPQAARGGPSILVRPVREEALRGEWRLGDRPLLDMASWDLRMIYSMHG